MNTVATIAEMQTRDYAIDRLRDTYLMPGKPVYTNQIDFRYTATGTGRHTVSFHVMCSNGGMYNISHLVARVCRIHFSRSKQSCTLCDLDIVLMDLSRALYGPTDVVRQIVIR